MPIWRLISPYVKRFPNRDVILIESGGDNLAATFSPELADPTTYVIDVSGGEKIPRKGGPGITRSDLLVMANMKTGQGVDEVIAFLREKGGLAAV